MYLMLQKNILVSTSWRTFLLLPGCLIAPPSACSRVVAYTSTCDMLAFLNEFLIRFNIYQISEHVFAYVWADHHRYYSQSYVHPCDLGDLVGSSLANHGMTFVSKIYSILSLPADIPIRSTHMRLLFQTPAPEIFPEMKSLLVINYDDSPPTYVKFAMLPSIMMQYKDIHWWYQRWQNSSYTLAWFVQNHVLKS